LSLQYQITDSDGLVPGYIYKIKTRSLNVYGYSDWSDTVDAGVADYPSQPNPVTNVPSETGPTYITIVWTPSLDT
jgi:hypothetical protein